MTFKTVNIPSDYMPYDKVIFCSNILINVRYIFNDNEFFPLLIGKGSIPKIWMYAKDSNKKSIMLIEKSISFFPTISVNINDDNKKLSVVINEKINLITILEIDYSSKMDIMVEQVNLQPIGYNIVGNKSSLHVGNNTVSGNTLQNVQSFIGLG